MIWIQPELKVLQSRIGMRDRRTDRQTVGWMDGQTDRVKPIYPPNNFVVSQKKNIDMRHCFSDTAKMENTNIDIYTEELTFTEAVPI